MSAEFLNAPVVEAIQWAAAADIEPRLVDVLGNITLDSLNPSEQALVAKFEVAKPSLLTDGKPTVMRTVAWLAHASDDPKTPYVNDNRLAFVKAELYEAAAKVSETSPLVMDWDHSATRGGSGQGSYPPVIGVWTRAEVAFDNNAGAWGILASGVMFSWLFQDLADAMLADQQRLGFVRFSMACLSKSIEMGQDANGYFEIAHNPTFFTLSALDVAAADKACIGLGEEGSSDPGTEARLKSDLKAASDKVKTSLEARITRLLAASLNPPARANPKESNMDEQLNQLTTANAELVTANATLVARVATLEQEAADAATAFEAEKATIADTHATRVAELETARDAAKSELEAANGEIARVAAELATASEKLVGFEAEKAALETEQARIAEAQRVETRLSTLPEAFRAQLEKRGEEIKAKIVAKIAQMSDEDFEFYKTEEIGVAGMKVSYAERSQREGILPSGGPSASDVATRVRANLK